MKLKICNLKMKKRFLKIAACLLACASLMVSVAIPGQAAKDRIWSKCSSGNIESLKKACQSEIQSKIKENLTSDFGQVDSVKIGGYTFTKKRYQHIAYGDYQNGVNSQGLHMKCGLDLLKESLSIFEQQLANEQKWKDIKTNSQNVLNAYEDIGDENDAGSVLMHCRLIHSNVSHTSRYLFPKNWRFAELKKALEIAIGQKAKFEDILKKKSEDVDTKKKKIQDELGNIGGKNQETKSENTAAAASENKNCQNKKTKKDLNVLLKQYVLNDMLYDCEKKQLALKDECFPNLYGYANTNGKSVSLHIIDIGEVEGNEESGQKILVQLVTDELSKEIVTFFPLNVQNLQEGDFRIVPNEGEDDADNNSNNSSKTDNNLTETNNNSPQTDNNSSEADNNSPETDNNSPETDNNSSKTKIYDIFQLDKLDDKQFLKRTKFEISDKFKNNASNLLNNRNMNVLRDILNKFKGHKTDEQSKKYFEELKAFVDGKQQNDNDKLTDYTKNAKNELESTKKVDTLNESNVAASSEKDEEESSPKSQLINKLKSEFEKFKTQNSDKREESCDGKELYEAKVLMLDTILANVSNINHQIKNANKQLENSIKNKKNDLVGLRSDIDGLRKRLANCVELMQKSGIETLLLKSKDKDWDKCEFAQGGLDLSKEAKNFDSVDKYVSELDQFLNDLLLDNNVFSSVIGLMKDKLKKEAQIEKEKAAKKAAEAKKNKEKPIEVDFSETEFDIFG